MRRRLLLGLAIMAILVGGYLYLYSISAPPSLRPIWIDWEPEVITVGRETTFTLTMENVGWGASGVLKVYIRSFDRYGGLGEPRLIAEQEYSVGGGETRNISVSISIPEEGFYRLIFDFGGRTKARQLIYVYDPDNPREEYRFAFFADNRPGGPLTPQPEQFKKLIRILNIVRPDFAILGGDIVYGYRSEAVVLAWQWSDFLSIYESSAVPIFVAPGNHEMKTGEAPSTGDRDAQILFLMNLGRLYYSFAYGKDLFLILDTDIVGEANMITGRQKEWMVEMLGEGQSYRYRFTAMHKPAFSGPAYRTITNDKEVTEIFRGYNVTVALQAHNHIFYKRYLEPTWFYVSGGAGSPLYVSPEEGALYHMLLITVGEEGVEVKVIPTELFEERLGEVEVYLRHSFTNEISFRRGDEEWVAEPREILLQGLLVRGEAKVEGDGYEIIHRTDVELDGERYSLIEAVLRPGGWIRVYS